MKKKKLKQELERTKKELAKQQQLNDKLITLIADAIAIATAAILKALTD